MYCSTVPDFPVRSELEPRNGMNYKKRQADEYVRDRSPSFFAVLGVCLTCYYAATQGPQRKKKKFQKKKILFELVVVLRKLTFSDKP
jgi:hypothetical protein